MTLALRCLLLALAAAVLSGCHTVRSLGVTGNTLSTTAAGDGAVLAPRFTTAAYRYIDINTASVYLTDLPLARLADLADPLDDVTGTVVHIHLFLVPKAGRTPIESTACNAAVRQAVFADGAKGLYTGGGFVLSRRPGGQSFSASVRNASLRLARATPGFTDRLGPATLQGFIVAPLDEPAALAIAERLQQLDVKLPPASPALPTPPASPTAAGLPADPPPAAPAPSPAAG